MPRRFINQLGENEAVDEVFLVAEKQLRPNRNGNLYLQLRLSDRTGSLTGMLWNASDRLFASIHSGDFVRVQGTTQFYNGNLQMILNSVERTVLAKADEADFVRLGAAEIDQLRQRLAETLRGIADPVLLELAERYLTDESFMTRFSTAPAGVKLHHAYRGGLLEHVVGLMALCRSVAAHYPIIDLDLLVMGAFLHDTGKILELSYDRDWGYTDAGQMVGHVVQGVGILDEKIRELESQSGQRFPEDTKVRLQHMIVSHHGEYEYGSPKLPMTLEAITLHFLDNLDSKLHSCAQLMREDTNVENNWTPFQATLGRKLYKSIANE
jgi:3'-5' exoribonuclease